MPSDLFTTSYLGSFTGLVAVTFLLVQFFKEPMKKYFSDWWIRLLAVFFALSIQCFTLYVTGNLTVETVGLAVLNSFLVAITAAGAHNISQPSNQPTVTELDYEPIIYKPQVDDVSPPIITPQPSVQEDSDPAPQTIQS